MNLIKVETERLHIIPLDRHLHQQTFAEAVREGFSASPKRLPCRFLYDARGSELFEQICQLPEYYPTRTENALLAEHADEIIEQLPPGAILTELGSGSAAKTRHLIEAFIRRQGCLQFMPIDISPTILRSSSAHLIEEYKDLVITAVAAEYQGGLRYLGEFAQPKLIVWLGGNVGNLTLPAAQAFLQRVRGCMRTGDRLLIGVDLMKSSSILLPAYNDSAGVTAAFNLNLLTRINTELGGRFKIAQFEHEARFNAPAGRIEMHLRSTCDQIVTIALLKAEVGFSEGETIHTESAHKYSPPQIDALAEGAGFECHARWVDDDNYFSVNLFAPAE